MGSSRPLLVILTVDSGVASAAPGANLYFKARLEESWLETEKVAAVPAPSFGTELAWEVGEEQVRELRRKRAAVRLKVCREQELLRHQMLDIRTAVRVQESGQAATTPHRLKGCSVATGQSRTGAGPGAAERGGQAHGGRGGGGLPHPWAGGGRGQGVLPARAQHPGYGQMGQARLPQLCRSSPCSSLPRFSLCVTLQSATLLSS